MRNSVPTNNPPMHGVPTDGASGNRGPVNDASRRPVLLEVRDLAVGFRDGKRLSSLVENVSFTVDAGECLGILGESGSGKSISLKAVLGLLDDSFTISGSARFEGRELIGENPERLRRLRGSRLAVVLQNPMTCFDPLYRLGEQMAETIAEHRSLSGKAMHAMLIDILGLMRIRDPEDVLCKYPHQLSGGMLQRIMIGLALSLEPRLLIADEPTTAIDSISQHSIMQEFLRIKQAGNVGLIFISHDLGVLSLIADRLVVMHGGRVVEQGSAQQILDNARDRYTHHLIDRHKAVMNRFLAAIHAGRKEVCA